MNEQPLASESTAADNAALTEPTLDEEIEELARIAADAALDKKALDLVVLDVRGMASYADFLIVCTGRNDRHVVAIADAIDDALSPYRNTLGREGLAKGHWVLMDFGDVVAHVFYAPTRVAYDLERLWSDAPRLDVEVPDELRGEPSIYDGYDATL